MSRNNKVTPSKIIVNSNFQDSANSNKELQYLMNYVNTKKCYHSSAAENAKIVDWQQKIAFQAEIWTLMEKRSIDWKEKPFDDKPAPAEDLGNIFDKKYAYEAPKTIVSGQERGSIPLNNTRKKLICEPCQGKGSKPCILCSASGEKLGKPCPMCSGQGSSVCTKCSKIGYIVRWAQLTIEWHTLYSATYPRNTFLPDNCIHDANGKQSVFDGDEESQNQTLESTFPHLLGEIDAKSPHAFRQIIVKQFIDNHFAKINDSTHIRRIKCLIQKLDITEIDYQSGTLSNAKDASKGPQVFTFLLYGGDEDKEPEVYEKDYPLSVCGCLGAGCACRSSFCTIA